jgi:hypothetical protein
MTTKKEKEFAAKGYNKNGNGNGLGEWSVLSPFFCSGKKFIDFF